MNELGNLIVSSAQIHAKICKVLSSTASVDAEEKTLFKSIGLSVQDLFAAQMVYEKVVA
jgi:ornithine cyclodeaminase/alanine dehydrogenase-like protein (mu-crystallin family)